MKNRLLILCTFAALLLVLAPGCRHLWHLGHHYTGSGKVISEERQVTKFDKIEVSGSTDVYISQGDTPALRIEADDNIMKRIKTYVEGRELIMNLDHGSYSGCHIKLFVTVDQLREVSCNGSGDIYSEKPLKLETVRFFINGSGSVKVEGTTDYQEIEVNGSGDVRNSKFVSKNTRVVIRGSGSVRVHATDRLEAEINGSGSIEYTGNPKTIDKSVRGVGSVYQRSGDKE